MHSACKLHLWPYIGLRDFLRIEKPSFYGYGGYVYEIVDKDGNINVMVITVILVINCYLAILNMVIMVIKLSN